MTPEEISGLGDEFQRQGNVAKAQYCYEQAIKLCSGYLPALANLATVLSAQNKLEAATALLYKVTAQTPNDPEQWLALGNVLLRQDKSAEAMPALSRALELRPENPDVHFNLAAVAYRKRDFDRAEILLEHTLSLGKTDHMVYFDLAHVKLAQGDLSTGLELYEYRWHTAPHNQAWDHHIPEWQGQDLAEKHILVHAEQGFGDIIMLSRFLPWLRAKQVTFAVPPMMTTLFLSQGFEVEVVSLDALPEDSNKIFDFQTPLYSMVRWLKISPSDIYSGSYLTSPVEGPLVDPVGFNVGICWASGNFKDKFANWRRRVTDLKLWLPLASVPNVRLWSLQRDTGSKDIADLSAGGLIADVMPEVDNWAATAKLISQLDLVISVDTGVVHLAGALGRPVWMLSQVSPCWRWWNIESGNGLPWYRDMKIYWRPHDDWAALLSDCLYDLRRLRSNRGV